MKDLMGGKKSENPSKDLVDAAVLRRLIYSRSSLNLVLRVSRHLKKPKTQQGFLPPAALLPSTYSVCTSIHFPSLFYDLNISAMDTQTSLSMLT